MIPLDTRLTGRERPVGDDPGDPLLSHEPTIELVARARGGDMPAMEALWPTSATFRMFAAS